MESTTIQPIFDRDGYIALPVFILPQRMNEIRREVERFLNTQLEYLPEDHVVREDPDNPASVRQIRDLQRYDEFFNDLARDDHLKLAAETVLKGPAGPIHVQYFNKPPGANTATPPHQDAIYFDTNAAETVELWLALDDADEDTGCMYYVRGSHVLGLLPHQPTGVTGFEQGLVDDAICKDPRTLVPCSARAGDLLVHSALIVHWSGKNESNHRQRRALSFIFQRGVTADTDDESSVREPDIASGAPGAA